MGLLSAAFFGATLLVLIAVHRSESGVSDTCHKANVCTAMKTLETKLENLIALVKKISMSLPTPPGKLGLTDFHWIFVLFFFLFPASALPEFNFLYSRSRLFL